MLDRALTPEIFLVLGGASSVRGFMESHKNPNKKALLNSRVINPDPQNLVLQGSELLTLNGVEDFDSILDLTDKKNALAHTPKFAVTPRELQFITEPENATQNLHVVSFLQLMTI